MRSKSNHYNQEYAMLNDDDDEDPQHDYWTCANKECRACLCALNKY